MATSSSRRSRYTMDRFAIHGPFPGKKNSTSTDSVRTISVSRIKDLDVARSADAEIPKQIIRKGMLYLLRATLTVVLHRLTLVAVALVFSILLAGSRECGLPGLPASGASRRELPSNMIWEHRLERRLQQLEDRFLANEESLAVALSQQAAAMESAMNRHSKDILGQTDYALRGRGGDVVPELTSPTRSLPDHTWFSQWIHHAIGWDIRYNHINPPTVAIDGDISVGNCWSFEGSQGQIGLLLAETLHVKAISIDNPPSDLLTDAEITRAPKDIVIWGLISEDDLPLLDSSLTLCSENCFSAHAGQRHTFVQISKFKYDTAHYEHVQTFYVPEYVTSLGITFRTVVVLEEVRFTEPMFVYQPLGWWSNKLRPVSFAIGLVTGWRDYKHTRDENAQTDDTVLPFSLNELETRGLAPWAVATNNEQAAMEVVPDNDEAAMEAVTYNANLVPAQGSYPDPQTEDMPVTAQGPGSSPHQQRYAMPLILYDRTSQRDLLADQAVSLEASQDHLYPSGRQAASTIPVNHDLPADTNLAPVQGSLPDQQRHVTPLILYDSTSQRDLLAGQAMPLEASQNHLCPSGSQPVLTTPGTSAVISKQVDDQKDQNHGLIAKQLATKSSDVLRDTSRARQMSPSPFAHIESVSSGISSESDSAAHIEKELAMSPSPFAHIESVSSDISSESDSAAHIEKELAEASVSSKDMTDYNYQQTEYDYLRPLADPNSICSPSQAMQVRNDDDVAMTEVMDHRMGHLLIRPVSSKVHNGDQVQVEGKGKAPIRGTGPSASKAQYTDQNVREHTNQRLAHNEPETQMDSFNMEEALKHLASSPQDIASHEDLALLFSYVRKYESVLTEPEQGPVSGNPTAGQRPLHGRDFPPFKGDIALLISCLLSNLNHLKKQATRAEKTSHNNDVPGGFSSSSVHIITEELAKTSINVESGPRQASSEKLISNSLTPANQLSSNEVICEQMSVDKGSATGGGTIQSPTSAVDDYLTNPGSAKRPATRSQTSANGGPPTTATTAAHISGEPRRTPAARGPSINPVTPAVPKASDHNLAKSPAVPAQGPYKTQKVHRKQSKLIIQDQIRKYALKLLGRADITSPFPKGVPRKEDITLFRVQKHVGPTVEDFRLDIHGFPLSPWNRQAIKIFAEDFTKNHDFKDTRAVEKMFGTHTVALRTQFAAINAGSISITRQKRNDDAATKAMLSRKRSFQKVWEHMPLCAMSEDELDGTSSPPRYVITNPIWRSEQVTHWLRTLDLAYLSTRFNENGRAGKGAFPHLRVPSTRVASESTAPKGLPKNWYAESYLQTLTSGEQKALEMYEPILLPLSKAVLSYAERYRGIKGRTDRLPPQVGQK
ncbi:hypothetical protein CONPUDRAFT_75426 [Coniophora puteana RWD-64-598 SS2]|uniref:SUN domain-containing protein n=1 Tax=Coniophora puteana (strain RWD-64-598) TaxID=741705 RepID=A0A5M3MEC1_CONPW|nr:uncharacterized protein CONPUDRAFT_75426 [Coniophora puteana RWD-64-598 SS2]EIW77572.1 hypothetical protein CONPUDRAFT_75426 [Coniophora puteana RWD-64-598 SS2]